MKSRFVLALLAAGVAFAGTQSAHANAQSSIKLLDADTVRVVDYSGKPPHKRQTISRDRQPELFAYYAERVDYAPQPLLASESRRSGAPGKNLPRNPLRVTGDPMEIAEFARFEEADDAEVKAPRNWRGAPGKGRAFSR
jgi:hypothetical protein